MARKLLVHKDLVLDLEHLQPSKIYFQNMLTVLNGMCMSEQTNVSILFISAPSTGLTFGAPAAGAGVPAQAGLPSFGGFQANPEATLNLTNKPSIGMGFGATTTTSTTTQANK